MFLEDERRLSLTILSALGQLDEVGERGRKRKWGIWAREGLGRPSKRLEFWRLGPHDLEQDKAGLLI